MVRLGLVGAGEWAQRLLSSVQGRSAVVRFAAVASRRPDSAKELAAREGLKFFSGIDDLVASPDVDAVVLATPHSLHASQVCTAARAGKHVFVEKPLALTGADARLAAAACSDARVVCAVGFNRRFMPSMMAMRTMIKGGELGTLIHLEGNFSGDSGYRYPEGGWRATTRESPVGGLTAAGIHIIDAFIAMAGEVETVSARSRRHILKHGIDDASDMTFDFRNGVTGYTATLLTTASLWRIQAFCAEGWVEVRDGGRLCVRRVGGSTQETAFGEDDGVVAELEAFAGAVLGSSPFAVLTEEAVHGTDVMEAVVISAASGGPVSVDRGAALKKEQHS